MYYSIHSPNIRLNILIEGTFHTYSLINYHNYDFTIRLLEDNFKNTITYNQNNYNEFNELMKQYFLYNFHKFIVKTYIHNELIRFNIKNNFTFYIQVLSEKILSKFQKFDINFHIYENSAYFIKMCNIKLSDLKEFLDYIKEELQEENYNKNLLKYIIETRIICTWYKEALNKETYNKINYLLQAKDFDLI